MVPHILEGHYVSGYVLWIKFNDGADGEVDLTSELHGEIFESLKDEHYFRLFQLHPEQSGTSNHRLAKWRRLCAGVLAIYAPSCRLKPFHRADALRQPGGVALFDRRREPRIASASRFTPPRIDFTARFAASMFFSARNR